MLKLTDWGRALCETATRANYMDTYASLYYKGEIVVVTEDGKTNQYARLVTASFSNFKILFPFLLQGSSGSSINMRYGEEFSPVTGVTAVANDSGYALNLVTLPYTITCNVEHDDETGLAFLTGVISNATAESITVRYLGAQYNARVANNTTQAINVALGIMSYFEFEEPITLAPNEDYAFKITMDYSR